MHMRDVKAIKAERAKRDALQKSVVAEHKAWNGRVARHGDRLHVDAEVNEESTCVRLNQLTPEGVLRHAWTNLGKSSSQKVGVDGVGNKAMAMMSSVSSAFTLSQTKWLSNVVAEVVESGACPFLQRHYDSTSNRMCMGQLQDELMPHARYAVRRNPSDPWRIVGWKEYSSIYKGKPRFGIFELLAQATSLHWSDGEGLWNGARVLHRPQVLQRSNASTIYRAVDMGTHSFSPAGLREICSRVHHMWINEQPDGCAANKRKLAKSADERPRNCFELSEQTCMPHQLWRVVYSRFGKLVGDLYALHVTCSNIHHQNSLQKELQALIDEEFLFMFGAPQPQWRETNKRILARTLFRRRVYVGGGCDEGFALEQMDEVLECELAKDILDFFNAAWDVDTMTHYCNGCCSGIAESRAKAFSLCLRMDVLMADDTRQPCMDNWDSLGKGLGKAGLSLLFHNVLPKVLLRALPTWQACMPGGGRAARGNDEAAARALGLPKKAWRCKCVFESRARCLDIILMNLYGCHVEHLLVSLDWLDERGDGYMDTLLPDTCPFNKCLIAVSRLIECGPPLVDDLTPVHRHFAGT